MPPIRLLLPLKHKTLVFSLSLLVLLVGHAAFLEDRSRAAAPSTVQVDNQIQLTLTTYENGQAVSRVISSIRQPGGSNEVDAASPLRPAAAGDLVLSQIYSGGGNPGSTYQNNYIEIFNRTNSAVSFDRWRISLAEATGGFNQTFSFSSSRGISIGAGKYLLIGLGPNSANGAPVPADLFTPPDPIIVPGFPPFPPINISPSGKIYITPPDTTPLFSPCPLPNAVIVDFVGYGTAANCSEGSGPTGNIGSNTAALRKSGGCTDSNNNAGDFLVGNPAPRNSSSPANICANQIDDADFFVRQHYADFLNRQPDAAGLAFWRDQILACGTDAACIELKRVNVSAAFFLSIEFQQTGYLAYRTYKSAFGNMPNAPVPLTFGEFLPDTQFIGQGVVVNAPGWEQQLENNKVAFFVDFVSRLRFRNAYPDAMTPAAFVDALFGKAGITPSAAERDGVISEFGAAGDTSNTAARARALRRVAENAALGEAEKNRAFVLMEYFGYLRRNPNEAPEPTLDFSGYNFWLSKLIQFNGDYIAAEMVKAFINSSEYRQRFGP